MRIICRGIGFFIVIPWVVWAVEFCGYCYDKWPEPEVYPGTIFSGAILSVAFGLRLLIDGRFPE